MSYAKDSILKDMEASGGEVVSVSYKNLKSLLDELNQKEEKLAKLEPLISEATYYIPDDLHKEILKILIIK